MAALSLFACGNAGLGEAKPSDFTVHSAYYHRLPNSPWNASWSTEKRLQLALPSIPANLNPFTNVTAPGQAMQRQLHGFLWKTNPLTGWAEPDILTHLAPISGKTNHWQISISQNRFFEPKNPLSRCSAFDVAFTLKAFSLPGLAHAGFLNALQPLNSIQVLNDSSLILEFQGADSSLIYALSDLPVLREAEWDPHQTLRGIFHAAHRSTLSSFPKLIPASQSNNPGQGLGWYAMFDFQPSQLVRMRLKNRPSQPQSAADTLDWIWLGDATGLENHLKYQRADVFPYLTHSDLLAFKKNPAIAAHYHLSAIKTQTFTFLAFNSRPTESGQHPALANPNVRLALACLTPKHQLLSSLFDSSIKPMVGLGHLGPKQSKPSPDFQPEKAKALLAAAGWKDSDKNGILDKTINGKLVELRFTLLYNAASRISEDLASLLQGHWMRQGVGLEKMALASTAFFSEAQNHNYDIILTGFSGKFSPAHMVELWHSDSWKNHGHNYTGFGDANSDALLEALAGQISPTKQEELLIKLQDLILGQTPWIPLYYSQRYIASHRRWHGVNVLALPPGFMPEEFRLGLQNKTP